MTGVSEVTVRLGDGGDDQLAGARAALAATLPAFDTLDWRSLDPLAAGMFEIIDAVLYVWLVIVLIALGFGLVNTLATAVIERTREFGLLRALGMRPRHVLAQVVMESVLVTLLGVVLGIAGGVALVALLHDGIDLTAWSSATALFGLGNVLVPRLLGADIVLVIVAALVFALVGSIYPAWRAVALAPLAALHGGRA
jgi:ABC-type lipoprotein release transport system permease subunit